MNAFTVKRMQPGEKLVNITKRQAEATYREAIRHGIRISRWRERGKWVAMRVCGERPKLTPQRADR